MHMVSLLGVVCVVIVGLLFGSFAGAQIWRLRAKQLVDDAKDGYEVDKRELKRLKPLRAASLKDDRSRCLHCGHILGVRDLIPLFSWVSTRGKCRHCKQSIGVFEPVIELGTMILFVVTYLNLPQFAIGFGGLEIIVWLIAMLGIVILFAYDLKWYILPNKVVFPLIGIAAVIATIRILLADDMLAQLYETLLAAAILSGLYYLLYEYSRYKYGEDRAWVGFGDVKLNLGLALLLGNWQLALLALFLANIIGILVVIPSLVRKKMTMKTQIPFGPLLIIGFLISLFAGDLIISRYLEFSSYLSGWIATLML